MTKTKFTISMDEGLLKRVDATVDTIKIRNRSHAVEALLKKALGVHKINTAVIQAGGEGTRLRPFTYELPKPLLPVKNRALMEYPLELLAKYNIRDIIIITGYLGEKVENHFGDGKKWGVRIKYLREKKKLGTAGSLRLLKKDLTAPFFLLWADILANINLDDMAQAHFEHRGLATIALATVADPSHFGVVALEGAKITGFVEKPKPGSEPSKLINAGIALLDPQIIKMIPAGFSMIEKDIYPRLVKSGRLVGFPFAGQWFDTGTPAAYEEVLKKWRGIK
ncbi:MAG: mannose-1-phosphate guanyltransferase [Candidatus Berkelbacteria bacterium Licking1014_2]|uniref:Mannose-1-phosphate guanyltransferase n=1 Tax=Candidatus Berkelbacteria bacterium Licking1014_2 TaxID=2017146 RepID=A0A554LX88_9BACT|nr:MAG: mannose-1-phosphate guanyltransferase [Candidatus Berkelbacteria bacterium Licking1014_2]